MNFSKKCNFDLTYDNTGSLLDSFNECTQASAERQDTVPEHYVKLIVSKNSKSEMTIVHARSIANKR